MTSSRGPRTPTNQTLCFRYSGTNAYLARKSSLLIAKEISVTRPDILIYTVYASRKQVQYASVKTVRLTYQALDLLHWLPKWQVQRGARTPTNQTLCFRYSGTNAYLAQKSSLLIALEISVTRPDILIYTVYASGKQVQYASVKTVRLTYQALDLLHWLPKWQVQGALGHQQIKHSASDILAQMPTLLKNPHCLLRKRFL